MIIKFYNKNHDKFYSLNHFIDYENKLQMMLSNEECEAMQISEDEVFNMINKHFKENF
jgi:hypothetical protein